jgi:hypothetical protein
MGGQLLADLLPARFALELFPQLDLNAHLIFIKGFNPSIAQGIDAVCFGCIAPFL